MGILQNQIPNSKLGWKGLEPPFNRETKASTLHFNSSYTNKPSILRKASILDEQDSSNQYRSDILGKKYMDNPPK